MFPALAQEAEFARIEAIFELMDRDSDGYVSREPDTCLRLPAARELLLAELRRSCKT